MAALPREDLLRATRRLVRSHPAMAQLIRCPRPDPFERTPLDRFTAIVTETGPMSPGEVVDLSRRFTVDPRIGAA